MNKLVSKNPVLRFLWGGTLASILAPIPSLMLNKYKNNQITNNPRKVRARVMRGPVPGKKPDGTLDRSITHLIWNEHPTTGEWVSGLYVKNGNRYWHGSNGSNTLIGPNDGPIRKPTRPPRRKKPVVSNPIVAELTNHPEDTLPVSDFLSKQENLTLIIPTAPAASVQGKLGKQYGSYWDDTMSLGLNDINLLRNNLKRMPELRTPSITYDRSGTRDWIRNNLGRGAYEYTGALRRALRYWLNGDKEGQNYDKNLLGVFGNLSLYAKQGAKLVSRNPIERFLQGRNLPTAPSVKERYSEGYRYLIPWMKKVRGPKTSMLVHPGEIYLYVKEVTPYYNDTTYVEIPEHTSFVDVKPRVASTNSEEDLNSPILDRNGWPTGHYKFKFNNSPEYEILKRRFNTAWNLAK